MPPASGRANRQRRTTKLRTVERLTKTWPPRPGRDAESNPMSSYVRPDILALAGYTPGEQPRDDVFIKLNTNENPYSPSPRVIDAIRASLLGDRLRKYPDPSGDAFRKVAARVLGVDPEGILI